MFLYIPLTEKLATDEIGPYTSCGILVLESTDGSLIYRDFVSDVWPDYDEVSELTDVCNREQVYPVHLPAVIEDRLYAG